MHIDIAFDPCQIAAIHASFVYQTAHTTFFGLPMTDISTPVISAEKSPS
jgi:hypothetical protein